MIDNSLKTVLDDKKISQALIKNSVEKLCNNSRLYIISDHCDNRKKYSSQLENLGVVRSLEGNLINGYTTLNSVVLDEKKRDLTLSNITVFSNRQPEFLSQKEYDDFRKGKIKNLKRKAEITKLVEEDIYLNMTNTLQSHLKSQSTAFKKENPNISLCHIHDRGSDSNKYFKFIADELQDDFVSRLKSNRNSLQVKINPKTKRENAVKLVDSEFANKKVYLIDKLTRKGKCYQNAKCIIEWDTLIIDEKSYQTVRATLYKKDGGKIYKDPIVLLTSLKVTNYLEAKEVYKIYLLRSKIESVFKFLKNVLGWEEFQVRDWESIKNIIAICFFIGGYFYEIKSELTKNKTIQMICDLARSKGKITHYFFLEGLKIMITARYVEQFKVQNNISEEFYKEMLSYAGVEDE